eukprot:536672_1
MTHVQICERIGKTSYSIDYCIMIPLITLSQIILFIHCATHWKLLKRQKVPTTLPLLFTVIQITVIIWDFNALLKGLPSKDYSHWFHNKLYCLYTSVISRIITPFCAVLLFTLLLFKLKISFQDSVFEVSKSTFYILVGSLYVPMSILMITYWIVKNPVCIKEFHAWDINESIFQCSANDFRGKALYINFGILGIIIIYNALLGFLFVYKLHQALKNMTQNTEDIEMLMLKNTILTVATTVSSLISYLVWFTDPLDVNFIVHLDGLINCIMIAMMYKYNNKYYVCMCGFCIKCCRNMYGRTTAIMLSNQQSNSTTAQSNVEIEL